jgi:hypothetical protein
MAKMLQKQLWAGQVCEQIFIFVFTSFACNFFSRAIIKTISTNMKLASNSAFLPHIDFLEKTIIVAILAILQI